MSREVKFRAWVKSEKKMMSVAGISWMLNIQEGNMEVGCLTCAYQDSSGAWGAGGEHEANEVDLMQCTGLTDKNGVEIYEGDIVQLVDLGHGNLGQYEVEFNDESAGFVMYFNQEIRHFIDHYSEDEIEVIGNIYENPELVEAVNE